MTSRMCSTLLGATMVTWWPIVAYAQNEPTSPAAAPTQPETPQPMVVEFQPPMRHWELRPSPVGGHIGIAAPIAVVAHHSSVIFDDFIDLGLSSGVTARLNPCWAFDFEFVVYDALKSKGGPSRLVVEPGVLRTWGTFSAGLRAAATVGEPDLNNFGLIPVVNQKFKFCDYDPLGWFVELDLPVFVNDGDSNRVTFSPQVQTGASF
jgi:hypothetical protein